jgi:demethylmenaquinone methyltransferase/2-methoxy-6-polyprenyl-1,4-benzoquinol methylase
MDNLQKRKTESYKIFDQIAPTYDFLNRLLSFGIDKGWRKKIVKSLPNNPSELKILDLATGTADVPLTLIKSPKVKQITGLDLSAGMVELGRKKVAEKNLQDKIELVIGDGTAIPFEDNSFDVVTISFGIRNFEDPEKSLRDIFRVLKPGGRLLIAEFSIPKNPIVRGVYFFYFRKLLPFIGNLISGHNDAYTYLNKTVEDFPYGAAFLAWMRNAQFKDAKATQLTFGIATLYQGDKCTENK